MSHTFLISTWSDFQVILDHPSIERMLSMPRTGGGYRHVVIIAGGNDLSFFAKKGYVSNSQLDQLVTDIAYCARFVGHQTGASISVLHVLPRYQAHYARATRPLNQKLDGALQRGWGRISTLKVQGLWNPGPATKILLDGIHLTKKGYQCLWRAVRGDVKKQLHIWNGCSAVNCIYRL